MSDVDVIIPAYNACDTIARALNSVAAQTLKPERVIVVVDGTDDGTLEIAESCRASLDNIELLTIWQENQGAGAARNLGIELAESTYVAFLDADDEWLPEKLAETMPRIIGTDNVLISHNVIVNDRDVETRIDCYRHFAESGGSFSGLYRRGYISTSTAVAKRDAVLAVGGFDTKLQNAQDFDLWLALTRDDLAFEVFNQWLTRNYVMPDSIMTNTDRRLDCCINIAERHAGSSIADLWFRITAVHYEALMAYSNKRQYQRGLLVLFRLPFLLFISTLKVFFRRTAQSTSSAKYSR